MLTCSANLATWKPDNHLKGTPQALYRVGRSFAPRMVCNSILIQVGLGRYTFQLVLRDHRVPFYSPQQLL